MFDLTGKTAVVTGGSRGIGRAICLKLAGQGANIVLNFAGNEAAAEETRSQCEALGVRALAVKGDVADAEACNALIEKAVSEFGGVDILVTHAPARGLGDAEDLPHQGFEAFRGLLDQYAPRYMLHGHVHLNYGAQMERVRHYGSTTIVNAFERQVVELEPAAVPERRWWYFFRRAT